MKPENEKLYREIPPYNHEQSLLVTKDKLPDKPGYQIAFTPISRGLLRKNPYYTGRRNFIPYPDWVSRAYTSNQEVHTLKLSKAVEHDGFAVSSQDYSIESYKETTEVTQINASEAGLELVDTLGYHFFRSGAVYNPDLWDGRLIGEGSESLVYRATIAGRDCVVKLVNHEGIKKMNEFSIFRLHYYPPDYLEKFGITLQISEALIGIEAIQPFETFELDSSPAEYVAGKDFLIQEYERRATVQHIEKYLRKMDKKKKTNETVEYWREWFEAFQEEISDLSDLFFVAGEERGRPFTQIDFNPPDWIITGFDRDGGKLKLALIDQAPATVGVPVGNYPFDEIEKEKRLKELSEKYKDSPLLDFLRSYEVPK